MASVTQPIADTQFQPLPQNIRAPFVDDPYVVIGIAINVFNLPEIADAVRIRCK